MKKKLYERPCMQVVELREMPQLLQASKSDYDPEPFSPSLLLIDDEEE